MKALKKNFETVALVIILLTSVSGSGNFTQPVLPASEEQGSDTVHSDSGYYGNDDENYFKKPPYQGGGTRFLQSSFWMVPVLRYLVTVSGKGISLRDEPLTVWLPVVLESAVNWWFHEQQLEDQLSQRGEVIQGFPLPVNQWPVNQPSEQERKTRKRKSAEAAPGKRKRAASRASGNNNNQSSGGGNGHEDEIKHKCADLSCPACNNGPCQCPQCLELLNFRKAFEEEYLTPGARVWPGRTAHIVQMLAYRQVTGHFPVPVTQLLSTLSQTRIQRYYPADINEIPAPPPQLRCDQTCKQLINLSGGRLVTLTIMGHCFVWSERAGTWSSIRLAQFAPSPYLSVRSFVTEAVVLPDSRIAMIDWHRTDETNRIKCHDIVLWTERYNGWKFEVIASYEEADPRDLHNDPNTLTCLPDGQLLFLLNRHLRAVAEYNDEWLAIQLTDKHHIQDIAVLSDGRFITWQRPEHLSQSTLSVWTKTEGSWLPSVIFKGCIMSWALILDTRLNILTSTGRFFFEEINDEWKITAQKMRFCFRQHTTPDGRFAELVESPESLEISIEHGKGWLRKEIIPSQFYVYRNCGYPTVPAQSIGGGYNHPLWNKWKCPRISYDDRKQLLSDGRIVTTINNRHIQIWLEEDGEWTSVNFPGSREQCITKLVELPQFRLAVLDISGAIRILNLMPGAQESLVQTCSASYTALEKRDILTRHFKIHPEQHDGLGFPLFFWQELLGLVSDEEIHKAYPNFRVQEYQKELDEQ